MKQLQKLPAKARVDADVKRPQRSHLRSTKLSLPVPY